MTSTNTHKITIAPLKASNRGQPYSVTFHGQTIVAKSYVPSHDACRYLVEHGYAGRLEVWATGEVSPRLHVHDIERAAKWTVEENASNSVHFRRYVPFNETRLYQQLQSEQTVDAIQS